MNTTSFNLKGREISVDYEYDLIPMRDGKVIPLDEFTVKDIDDKDFEITEVYDSATGEKIKCTKEIRRMVKEIFLKETKETAELLEQ